MGLNDTLLEINDVPVVLEANCEYLWSTMEVPWHKCSSETLSKLENNERSRDVQTDNVHSTVAEIGTIKSRIPSMAFKHVARKIVEKYPSTFRDIDSDGIVIGDGTYSLICKMVDRNHYLNRPHKRGGSSLSSRHQA